MKNKRKIIQYTIRDVPPHLDRALRRLAESNEKSLNQFLIEALARVTGNEDDAHDDLDALIGSWVADPDVDSALLAQRTIDKALWK